MGSVRRGGMKSRALILDFFLLLPAVALAAEPAVEVEVDAEKRSFTRGELLALGPINWRSFRASFRLKRVGQRLPSIRGFPPTIRPAPGKLSSSRSACPVTR